MKQVAKGAPLRAVLAFSIMFALGQTGAQAAAIQGPGLSQPGYISYDHEGVPTVVGATDEDAAWLMGYAHARNRFFQMDTLRRGASGTVAELVGPAGLAQDIQVRTLGTSPSVCLKVMRCSLPQR